MNQFGVFEGEQWRQGAADVGNVFTLNGNGGEQNLNEYVRRTPESY